MFVFANDGCNLFNNIILFGQCGNLQFTDVYKKNLLHTTEIRRRSLSHQNHAPLPQQRFPSNEVTAEADLLSLERAARVSIAR